MDLAQRKLLKAVSADATSRRKYDKIRDREASPTRVEVMGAQLPGFSPLSESGTSPLGNENESKEPHVFSFDRLPIMEKDTSGRLVKGLAIDYWAYAGGALLISGWVLGDAIKQLCPGRTAPAPGVTVSLFRRPDVENAYPAFAAGILAVISSGAAEDFNLFGFRLKFPVRRENDGNCDVFLTEHAQRFGFLFESLPAGSPERVIVARQIQSAPETYKGARGFLEQSKGVPGHGGLAVGWAVSLPGVKLALLDQAGCIVPLVHAIRWHRPDIVQALGQDFGNYTFNAGLLQAWQHPFRIGDEIRIVAFDGDAAHLLSHGHWEAAPVEPVSFARWAFELPTPLERFAERLEHHDGAIIETLIARDRTSWRTGTPEVHTFGTLLENPRCSIIVPLYGRFDFMLNQMLEFSRRQADQAPRGPDLRGRRSAHCLQRRPAKLAPLRG
jgi:O-antigen biosynthesis protein